MLSLFSAYSQPICKNFIPESVAGLDYILTTTETPLAPRWNENYIVPKNGSNAKCEIEVSLDFFNIEKVQSSSDCTSFNDKIDKYIIKLNQAFNGTKITFVKNRAECLTNDVIYDYMVKDEYEALEILGGSLANNRKIIQIFFVNSIELEKNDLNGIAHSIPGCRVTIKKNADENTFIHEIGHVFGLYHTFETNSGLYQDGISDTPDDDYVVGEYHNHVCGRIGYEPICKNFMTYSQTNPTEFSPLQKQKMYDIAFYFFQVEGYENFNFQECQTCWFSVPTLGFERICTGTGFKIRVGFYGAKNTTYPIKFIEKGHTVELIIPEANTGSLGYIDLISTYTFNDLSNIIIQIGSASCIKKFNINNWACNSSAPCHKNTIGDINIIATPSNTINTLST